MGLTAYLNKKKQEGLRDNRITTSCIKSLREEHKQRLKEAEKADTAKRKY